MRAGGLVLFVLSLAAVLFPQPVRAEGAFRYELRKLTLVASRSGVAEVLLRARRAELLPGERRIRLEQVHARWPGADGNTSGLELECARGELDLDSREFLATGGVHGRTRDGREFRTAWVRYDAKRGVASTDADVEIREGTTVLRGGGFRYRPRDGRLRLLGGATVTGKTP